MDRSRLDDPGIWSLDTFRVAPGSLGSRAMVVDGTEGHHAVDVVRVREGDIVRLIDGEGVEAIARVDSTGGSKASVSVLETRSHERGEAIALTVVQALLKGRSFDDVVRRCSELGVAEIIPAISERTIGRIPQRAEESRLARWRAVALAATKQSRGVFVPRIGEVRDISSVCELAGDYSRTLVAWEEEAESGLKASLEGVEARSILLVVGPEGGFSSQEVRGLVEAGASPVSVGSRVLRADWAAAAIAAMVSHQVGGLLP